MATMLATERRQNTQLEPPRVHMAQALTTALLVAGGWSFAAPSGEAGSAWNCVLAENEGKWMRCELCPSAQPEERGIANWNISHTPPHGAAD